MYSLLFALTSLMLTVSCSDGPSKKQIEAAEKPTKVIIAYIEMVEECYDDAYNSLHTIMLDENSITENGYGGNGVLSPEEIISAMDNDLTEMENALGLLSEEDYVSMKSSEINDGTIEGQHAESILKKAEKVPIAFSEFTSIKTSGNTKMWFFTELNSGYEFTLQSTEKGVRVDMSEAGAEKINNKIKEQAEYVYNLYNSYLEKVQEKKNIAAEKKERERENVMRLFGW